MDTRVHPILIIDDDSFQRRMIRIKLQTRGHEVNEAHDGIEAIGFLLEQQYSLVLLDVVMPRLNGWEVLDQIRATHNREDLPVIMMTARDHGYDEQAALERGANGYLTKPIDFRNLDELIQQLKGSGPAAGTQPATASSSAADADRIASDAAESLKATPDLKLSLLEGITNNLPGVVFRATADTERNVYVSYQSNGLENFLGYRWKSVHDIVAATDPSSRQQINEAFMTRGLQLERIRISFPVKTPSGQRGWVECRATPHRLPSGESVWDALLLDITEMKALEEQLQAAQAAATVSVPAVSLPSVDAELLNACIALADAVDNGNDIGECLARIRELRRQPDAAPPINAPDSLAYRDAQGFISQCSKCRRVKNMAQGGNWELVPEWSRHMPRNTSHTVCPDCTCSRMTVATV